MISKSKALEIIEELNLETVISQCYHQNPESNFHELDAMLNLHSGEVEYMVLGNNDSPSGKYIRLYSLPGNFRNDMDDADIAGNDDVPAGGVTAFGDYDERCINALVFYAEEFDIKKQLTEKITEYFFERERAQLFA